MDRLLWHRVDEWAERLPDQAAMRCRGRQLTYLELAERSNQLAQVLRHQGVKSGDRVGIYLGKSLETAISIYGILKAGAAYVPVDPSAPADRVQSILRNCGIRHLVSQPDRIRRLPDEHGLTCVIGARETGSIGTADGLTWDELGSAETAAVAGGRGEDDLAYIMYTSGSTGAPKGLMHTHASGLAYTRLSADLYQVTERDRLGNHSPLHFDMSTFEYLTGPQQGATTVILPEEATFFPRSMADLVEAERLTFWYSVPLALIQLLEQGDLEQRDCSAMRWVLFGGEPFAPKHLKRLMELWPQARFSNVYGPAEVNQCTYYHLPGPPEDLEQPIPLGQIWNETLERVVNEEGGEVEPGEVGELWIQSTTMMQGYWGQPELDANAFAMWEGRRYYRTGDLVRRDVDGPLLFMGRKDRQVKVRGYRVELDEVEAALASHPDVTEAAVVAPRGAGHTRRICAVVLLREGGESMSEALRQAVADRLPAYAVPERVDIRASLPRTGSGKVNRTRLEEDLST